MGHIMVPVPPGCPLQGLAHTVGRTLGVPSDRVCLTSDHGGPYLETDEDVGASPSIWATLLVPFNDSPYGHHVRVFDGTTHGSCINTKSPLPAENIPFFLCHTLALAHDFACTWTPFEAEDGSVYWCFLPSEGLIADSGWSAELVRCNLRRGCIEANPGPHRKTRNTRSVVRSLPSGPYVTSPPKARAPPQPAAFPQRPVTSRKVLNRTSLVMGMATSTPVSHTLRKAASRRSLWRSPPRSSAR